MVKDPVLEHGKEATQKGYQRKGTGHHVRLHSLILRGQDSNSWPPTPVGKTAREDRRAAHGTPGTPAGIAGIDTRILARGQQRSGYGFMVFAALTFRC